MEDCFICPLCDEEMVQEEGLFWCEACGINNDSETYKDMMDKKNQFKKEQKVWEK